MRKHHKKLEVARKNLGVDVDEKDAQVREAEAAFARATEESAAKRRKPIQTSVTPELDKAIDDAGCAVLGGKPAVG